MGSVGVPQIDLSQIDVSWLENKYEEERKKRARKGGFDSYIGVEGIFKHYEEDPYTVKVEREPLETDDEVLIIGGGFGGLLAAIRLHERGITNIRMVEKAGGFGGTWYWNRYPGAQCDVEAYIYMPLLEETGYVPTSKYVGWRELLEYSDSIGKRYGLHDKSLFHTGVTHMKWNDPASQWELTTDRGDTLRARHVIAASGPMHKPKLPGVEGISTFKNHSFHTSRWDYAYTGGADGGPLINLKDKRVGLIGTGATAIQCVPFLGETAKELYVFQRTPSSVDVRNNSKTDVEWYQRLTSTPGWQMRRRLNFWTLTTGGEAAEDEVDDSWTSLRHYMPSGSTFDGKGEVAMAAQIRNQLGDYAKMNSIRTRVDDTVTANPRHAELLKPWFNRMCKRPCFADTYLPTFNKPSVHLIDTCTNPISAITETSIITANDDQEYPLDCLIYGTGFEVFTTFESRTRISVTGKSGQSLTEKHDQRGMHTLHGVMTNDFPNLYFIHTAQAAAGINVTHCWDVIATHISEIIKMARDRDVVSLQPSVEAEEKWTQEVVTEQIAAAAFLQTCTPGYYNHEGKFDAKSQQGQHMELFRYMRAIEEWRKRPLAGMEVRMAL